MEKEIVKEICKNLRWYEKVVVRILNKTYVKVYKLGITFGFNNK